MNNIRSRVRFSRRFSDETENAQNMNTKSSPFYTLFQITSYVAGVAIHSYADTVEQALASVRQMERAYGNSIIRGLGEFIYDPSDPNNPDDAGFKPGFPHDCCRYRQRCRHRG